MPPTYADHGRCITGTGFLRHMVRNIVGTLRRYRTGAAAVGSDAAESWSPAIVRTASATAPSPPPPPPPPRARTRR